MEMVSLFERSRYRTVYALLILLGVSLIPILIFSLSAPGSGSPKPWHYGIPPQIPPSSLLPSNLGEVAPPAGSVSFCLRNPEQCRAEPGSAVSIVLTPEHWRLIQSVNSEINRRISRLSDLKHYGRQEYWIVPADGYGDCEDYALAKQKRLHEAGFPMAALRLAIVLTAAGKRHAVLTVTTSGGDYVLDNALEAASAWRDTRFSWLMRQDPHNPRRWSLMKGGVGTGQTLGPVSSFCH